VIEAAWCLTPDRLARSYAYQILILDEFARYQVPVRFADAPPLDDPQGRFHELGDEDIVGPMTVSPVIKVPSGGQARSSRKRTFLKSLQDFKTNTGLLLGRATNH